MSPRKPGISVEPRPGGLWAVQKDGTKRASSLHERKTDAVQTGRAQAKRERTEFTVKNQEGRIQSKDSYGNDPYPPKG